MRLPFTLVTTLVDGLAVLEVLLGASTQFAA